MAACGVKYASAYEGTDMMNGIHTTGTSGFEHDPCCYPGWQQCWNHLHRADGWILHQYWELNGGREDVCYLMLGNPHHQWTDLGKSAYLWTYPHTRDIPGIFGSLGQLRYAEGVIRHGGTDFLHQGPPHPMICYPHPDDLAEPEMTPW